jgi:hypothetical protein
MTRTGERTTVTSEAVPGVALTLSAGRGYHGTALKQIAEALELRSASWATRPATSLLSAPGRSSHSSQPKS